MSVALALSPADRAALRDAVGDLLARRRRYGAIAGCGVTRDGSWCSG
ncbi:MAG TPA: hypothetical protein VKF59_19510 [Candidatus Dormibacteraeota bacterium]|nr:hypothetical protein [Candidatus Dormibacteraeota bacterium]